jgi:TrpR family trp operon transcriptional repressor
MAGSTTSDIAMRELASVLAALGKAGAVHDVLFALLTPREREKIALRWRLLCLLQQGLTQRAVAAQLGISLCKITRGSRELKYGPAAFRKAVRLAVDGAAGNVRTPARTKGK